MKEFHRRVRPVNERSTCMNSNIFGTCIYSFRNMRHRGKYSDGGVSKTRGGEGLQGPEAAAAMLLFTAWWRRWKHETKEFQSAARHQVNQEVKKTANCRKCRHFAFQPELTEWKHT